MQTSVRLFVLSSAVLAFCYVVPPSANGQSLKDQLAGTWKLVSWTRLVGGVEEPGLMGRDAVGHIMFAPDGHMCFTGMRADRPKFASQDARGGTSEEKTVAFDTYSSYCGRYEVNDQERSVVFRLELSSYPNWTGTAQKRFVEMKGNSLRISSPPILSGGREIVGVVLWERPK